MLSAEMGSTQHRPKGSKSARFRAFLIEHQNCRNAREACSQIGEPYNRKNANLFYGVRSARKKVLSQMLRATPSTPSESRPPVTWHHVTLTTALEDREVAAIQAKVDGFKNPNSRSWSRWYRSSNRNGQLVFTNKRVLTTLWPSTGQVQSQIKGETTEERARDLAKSSLVAGGIEEGKAREIALMMSWEPEHFVVEQSFPCHPFHYDGLVDSVGVDLWADGSHRALEGRVRPPNWADTMRASWSSIKDDWSRRQDEWAGWISDLLKENESLKLEVTSMKQEQRRTNEKLEMLKQAETSTQGVVQQLVNTLVTQTAPVTQPTQPEQPKGEPEYRG
jgi:hypothetical protein